MRSVDRPDDVLAFSGPRRYRRVGYYAMSPPEAMSAAVWIRGADAPGLRAVTGQSPAARATWTPCTPRPRTVPPATGGPRNRHRQRPRCSPAGTGGAPRSTATAGSGPARSGGRTVVRWSDAGHPAPLFMEPGGVPRLLGGADVVPGVELPPGSTRPLPLYPDGLGGRRSDPDGRAAADLIASVASCLHRPLDAFCDEVVRGGTADTGDDIAVPAPRVRP